MFGVEPTLSVIATRSRRLRRERHGPAQASLVPLHAPRCAGSCPFAAHCRKRGLHPASRLRLGLTHSLRTDRCQHEC